MPRWLPSISCTQSLCGASPYVSEGHNPSVSKERHWNAGRRTADADTDTETSISTHQVTNPVGGGVQVQKRSIGERLERRYAEEPNAMHDSSAVGAGVQFVLQHSRRSWEKTTDVSTFPVKAQACELACVRPSSQCNQSMWSQPSEGRCGRAARWRSNGDTPHSTAHRSRLEHLAAQLTKPPHSSLRSEAVCN